MEKMDFDCIRKEYKKHEERIKSKINSKDPVLEILDDSASKQILVGIADFVLERSA